MEINFTENTYATVSLVQFLFAIFCAPWAQNTGRSSWLWFYMGWLFAPITGLFFLAKNSKHKHYQPLVGAL